MTDAETERPRIFFDFARRLADHFIVLDRGRVVMTGAGSNTSMIEPTGNI